MTGGRPSAVQTFAVLVFLGIAGAMALGAYAVYRVWERGALDEAPGLGRAEAIVVLGAAQYDGRPSPVFRARLDHAIALWRAGRAPRLIMTGGRQPSDRTTEAATGAAYAMAEGVPQDALLMEDRGRSTLESLEAVAEILEEMGGGPTIFVSDRSHMLRVIRIAKDLGVDAYGSPVADSPVDATLARRIGATIHELGALAWYGLGGRGPAELRGAVEADP